VHVRKREHAEILWKIGVGTTREFEKSKAPVTHVDGKTRREEKVRDRERAFYE
jgi:hypothetical protein